MTSKPRAANRWVTASCSVGVRGTRSCTPSPAASTAVRASASAAGPAYESTTTTTRRSGAAAAACTQPVIASARRATAMRER